MHTTTTNLLYQLRISEQGLQLRREFLRLTDSEIELLSKYANWMERVAPQYVRDFYDFQFEFPETRAFFEQYAQKKGISLTQLRAALEQAQANYLLDIFREARRGGAFGAEFSSVACE